ncbi:AAA family ATPase [Pleomorphomonas sp. PLEO]|uniref:AAA family ATPase n=1 Tax=Pleomorphomonas sp. PLEO TaxID=3239306 RepID=UPI00351DE76F
MKIISLRAENVKRLSAAYIEPSGNLVEITGKNGAGKTSVLDALWIALKGRSVAPPKPIREGAEKAVIEVNLGKYTVTRTFNLKEDGDYTTSVKVENQEGFSAKKPQDLLDSLLGPLTIDPLAFARMPSKDKFETLKAMVPGVDFAAIAAANKKDFDARSDANRQAASFSAQATAILLPEEIPEPIDEIALVEKVADAAGHNADIEQRRARRLAVQAGIDARTQQIASLEEELAELKQANETDVARLQAAPPLPDLIDVSDVRLQIDAARATNAIAFRAKQKADLLEKAAAQQKLSDELTTAMATRTTEKTKKIAAAELPVPGLTFGDDETILLNGVPFEQGSDAEQLRASIAIAAAVNKDLKIVRVRDGSLLDDDSWQILKDFAEANDVQVWAECVDSSRPGAIVIEDGSVAGIIGG